MRLLTAGLQVQVLPLEPIFYPTKTGVSASSTRPDTGSEPAQLCVNCAFLNGWAHVWAPDFSQQLHSKIQLRCRYTRANRDITQREGRGSLKFQRSIRVYEIPEGGVS